MKIKKHEYYMGIAKAVAAAGTCPRRQVGAVIVSDDQIMSTGYNGAPRGMPDCLEEGCELEHGHCVRSVHSELNAIIQAADHGVQINGATLFTTASCCRSCMMACINARIKTVVYSDRYESKDHQEDKAAWSFDAAASLGIDLIHLDDYGKPIEIEAKIMSLSGRGLAIYPLVESIQLRKDQPRNRITVNGKEYKTKEEIDSGKTVIKTVEIILEEIE